MYTMIIADDEALSIKSLGLFMRRDFPEIEIVGEASNGVEMVAQIEKLRPDIAIVDINMPGIDGISAIRMLLSKGIKTHFIINTAYSDFDYVKSALKMKVDGYLLKPSVREESIVTIRQVCDNISREKDESLKSDRLHSFFRTVSPMLENEILLSVCSGMPAEKEFRSFCEVNDIRYSGGCIVTYVNTGEAVTDARTVRALVEDALRNTCDHMLLAVKNTVTLFLLLPEAIDVSESDNWAFDVAELVEESLYRSVGIRYRVGRGGFYEAFARLADSYRESLEILKRDGPPAGAEPAEREENAKTGYYVDFALRYIDTHYQEGLSLDLVAAQIGISPFYLSRLIKQLRGVAFVEYLTDVRVNRAREMALKTALPSAEIATRCGYLNVSYFYKVFKKATGMTIGEYRRAGGKDSRA